MLPEERQSPPRPPIDRLRVLPRPAAGGRSRAPRGEESPDTLDRLAFSGLLAAAVAPALCAAAALACGSAPPLALLLTAFGGTLAVYDVDRLRDLDRDRLSAPQRSAFVSRNRHWLCGLAATGAVVGGGSAIPLGPAAWLVCALVLCVGLLHRRLKHDALMKSTYVTVAWLGVTVGLPALSAAATPTEIAWTTAVFGTAIGANLVASNAARLAAAGDGWTLTGALRLAAGLATLGVGAALLAPEPLVALAWIPLAQLACLLGFRRGERYRLVALDGSLVVGALLAVLLLL